MIVSALILLTATLAVAAYAAVKHPAALPRAARFTSNQIVQLAVRLPPALVAANCLAELIPDDAVGMLIGHESGITGMLMASIAGALIPGGPMISFPIVLVLAGDGAGLPQLTALIAGWCVFALHRLLAYEVPMLGWRFAALRLIASLFIPLTAGLLAAGVLALLGLDAITLGVP